MDSDLVEALFYMLIFYIFPAFCLFKIANKIKEPNSWMAWIPFLHFELIFNIAGKSSGTIFLVLIPGVNLYVYITAWIAIAEMLNEPKSMGVIASFPVINIFPLYFFAFRSNLP